MKKKYIKPQIKSVAVRSMGFLLAGSYNDIKDNLDVTNVLGSREDNSSWDEEEEEDTGGWFK